MTHEALTDTAELIQNRIRMTPAGLYLSQPPTERFSTYGAYTYKVFRTAITPTICNSADNTQSSSRPGLSSATAFGFSTF